ncbi:MAG TPA: nuclear transport factor 2 family protein [Mycobacteriales bacterium]|nr:nuclear transport factor 2 family protein [Mycobacteriales bacterium]
MTLADDHDRAALLARDQEFFDALVAADSGALDALLAADFLIVDISTGTVFSRAELLGAVSSGAVQFPAVEAFPDEAVVRRVDGVGIIVGRTGMNFTNPDGTAFSAGSRYTHIYAREDSGWRLLSAQGTQISAPLSPAASP